MSGCCCREQGAAEPWIDGCCEAASHSIPRVRSTLSRREVLGMIRVRLGVRRNAYTVPPGLYALGDPDEHSHVLVTANYKLTFDLVRHALAGNSVWLLVLDTRGINVWCAAGKGTFGTEELIARIESTKLDEIVSHRHLILPQLGATGVRAPEVGLRTGFKVRYGPVRIEDLSRYISSEMQAMPEMRRVRFTLRDRLLLTPVELVGSWKLSLAALILSLIISGIGREGFSPARAIETGSMNFFLYCGALLTGTVLTAALLPWLPGRAFSLKGAFAGSAIITAVYFTQQSSSNLVPWLFLFPAVSSFFAMNFTGSSTFTSLAGVQREVTWSLPIQILFTVVGLMLLIMGRLS